MSAELVCAATDPAWLDRRREGITATDIVTIAGLVTWDSPWALYHRKLGLLPEVEQSDRMRLGSWLEDQIAGWWFAQYSPTMLDMDDDKSVLYRSNERRWQMATPDRVLTEWIKPTPSNLQGGPDVARAVLECKTADRYQTGWGPDGSDQVPAHVWAQVLWQMDTLGVSVGHVAVVFLPSGEFRSYTIRHDAGHTDELDDLLATCSVCQEIDGLRDLGFGFMSRILRREPPPLDGLEVTTDALRALHPAPDGREEVDYGLVESYDWHKGHEADHKRLAQQALNEIRGQMGDAHEATVDGRVVFRRTIGKRAGYTVAPSETDTLRRIGKEKHDED